MKIGATDPSRAMALLATVNAHPKEFKDVSFASPEVQITIMHLHQEVTRSSGSGDWVTMCSGRGLVAKVMAQVRLCNFAVPVIMKKRRVCVCFKFYLATSKNLIQKYGDVFERDPNGERYFNPEAMKMQHTSSMDCYGNVLKGEWLRVRGLYFFSVRPIFFCCIRYFFSSNILWPALSLQAIEAGCNFMRAKFMVLIGSSPYVSVSHMIERFEFIFEKLAGKSTTELEKVLGIKFESLRHIDGAQIHTHGRTEIKWIRQALHDGTGFESGFHPDSLLLKARAENGK